jgi:hypothetical protein
VGGGALQSLRSRTRAARRRGAEGVPKPVVGVDRGVFGPDAAVRSAGFAGSAGYAGYAGSAGFAGSAGSAGSARSSHPPNPCSKVHPPMASAHDRTASTPPKAPPVDTALAPGESVPIHATTSYVFRNADHAAATTRLGGSTSRHKSGVNRALGAKPALQGQLLDTPRRRGVPCVENMTVEGMFRCHRANGGRLGSTL